MGYLVEELDQKPKLKEHLSYSQQLLNYGSWSYEIEQGELYLSDEIFKILERSRRDLANTEITEYINFVHPDDRQILKDTIDKAMQEIESEGIIYRVITASGREKYVFTKIKVIYVNGGLARLFGIVQDITSQKLMEDALKEAAAAKQAELNLLERRFQLLNEEANDVYVIIAADGTITYVSEASKRVIGWSPAELIGKKVFDYWQNEEYGELAKIRQMIEFVTLSRGRKTRDNVILPNKSGIKRHFDVQIQNLLEEPAIEGIVIRFRDVTAEVERKRRFDYLMSHDEVTGLPNHLPFDQKLSVMCLKAEQEQTQFALMMIDINGLKRVNYTLGYDIGNQLLKMAVIRLKSCLNDGAFLARYSDTHFALIIPNIQTSQSCERMAQAILDSFKQTYSVEGYEINLYANIGIAIFPRDGRKTDEIKRKAQFALFKAQKEGKNSYKIYPPEIDLPNYREFIIYNDLGQALEKNQFKVYYQPIVALKTDQLLAAEALLRWEHPEWGMVSPAEFIPIAEETGLIVDIEKWIIHEVCRTYRDWQNRGLPQIKVSVNFSGMEFFENDFVNKLLGIVAGYDLDPSFLIIEISEKTFMENLAKISVDIWKLQQHGIQIALDDFGSGYSSLAYLSAYNIDIIKLDRSLVHNFSGSETNAIITRSIVKMIRELNMKIVAEGIEYEEQLLNLQDCNCFAGQGYIYDKPLERKKFESVLLTGKCKPTLTSNAKTSTFGNRRRFFRIKFYQLLEADMTLLEVRGRKLELGNTKVLIKDIGAGGLCFISNIKLPIGKFYTLQFTTNLLGREIKLNGVIAWGDRMEKDLYTYGVEFTITEMERMELIKVLNQVQIKMRKSYLFEEGSFVSVRPAVYFFKGKTKTPSQ